MHADCTCIVLRWCGLLVEVVGGGLAGVSAANSVLECGGKASMAAC